MAGNIGLRPHNKYPRLCGGIYFWDEKHGGVYTCCGIDDEGVYKIIYTGHTEALGQIECLATAEDGLYFQKYEGNPSRSKRLAD
ncbi:hypothetical protein DWY99_04845 [[Clostridium] leptum]|uniref:Uncharacterized protein n=1 Tax=[Clostridium] leptum TaxID=1535 RepID=A0A412AYZ8_9FIRM|nr:hypothetical protein DWY99_04845 [[Clostridium] leptum]